MATRSDIIVHLTSGKWARVYCHHDGYLEHNGALLQEHYNSQQRAAELILEGDMSSLAPRCDKPSGHSFDKPVKGYTVYYGRDRGEKDCEARISDTLVEAMDGPNQFTYVWDNERWWLSKMSDKGEISHQSIARLLTGVTPSFSNAVEEPEPEKVVADPVFGSW